MSKYLSILFLLITSILSAQPNFYRVDVIRGADTTGGGCSDMDSMIVRTTGIVHGINLQGSSNRIQYSLIDKSIDTLLNSKSGIGIFKSDQNLPVTLNEGDSINVIGLVTCFNGLSQIVINTVQVLSSNRPLVNVRDVMFLSESTESMLVRIKNLEFVSSSWPVSPSGSGFTAKAFRGIPGTTGYIEFDIRIDNDCDLFGAPMPQGKVDIVGLGGQFDNSIPRDSKYQLLPRRSTDITPSLPQQVPVVKFSESSVTVEEGNNMNQITVQINNPSEEQISVQISAVDSTTTSDDYSLQLPQLVTFPANTNQIQVFTYNIVNDTINEPNEYFSLRLRKLPGNYTIGSDSIFRIKITGNPLSSTNDIQYLQITPNPITDYSIVKITNVKIDCMKVYNYQGKLEFYSTRNVSDEMKKINSLPQGIYKAVFSVGNKNITRTIIKQ
jgi:hypothetical protein